MRACIQRVSRATVAVDGEVVGAIGRGLLVLLGVESEDTEEDAKYLAEKVAHLRIFPDDEGKMNRSVTEIAGHVLVVSQFTLLGDCRRGRRPSFVRAATPALADDLYQRFTEQVSGHDVKIASGRFQAHMDVELVNDGPVTLLLDSRKDF